MSNYTITTNFGAKDLLNSGNPLKLILGAQFTTEFTNIATAIATKVDALSGSFTGTLTGMTGATTGTINYLIANGVCTLTALLTITGTSNSTSMTMTGLPGACTPSGGDPQVPCALLENNTQTDTFGAAVIANNGVISFLLPSGTQYLLGQFTSSGTKGISAGWTVTYPLT